MKNLPFALALLASFAFSSSLHGSFSLRIGDPRFSGSTQQGTITEALLSVHPKGLYLEYGLYLTFSAQGTSYSSQDSLEVVLRFDLPAGAIVHDSWLWVGNDIIRAKILDKWTASSIYEGIVQRRMDPSILFKQTDTQYELRVFPMKASETRKVKITYLVPANWSKETVQAELPIQLLKTSKTPLTEFTVLAWPDAGWQNPSFPGNQQLGFSVEYNASAGTFYKAEIPSASLQQGLSVGFASPLKNGHYLRVHDDGDGGIYQLAILPGQIFEQENARKIAVLLDFDASGGTISANTLIEQTRKYLHEYLSANDSFNLILSNLVIHRVSDSWLSADSATIESVFNGLNNPLSSYSNLAPLIANGIEFIQGNGNSGRIMLASNATQYGNYLVANTLLTDLTGVIGTPAIPVHILNYHNSNSPVFNIGGIPYYGNEYFFFNFAKLTGGSYHTVRNSTLPTTFVSLMENMGGALQAFDFHTSLEGGYCYGRFYIGEEPQVAYFNRPILQIGKYQGNFPFKISLAGELNANFVSAEITIPTASIAPADSFNREMWYGNYIRLLEAETQNTSTIGEIVYNSLSERVLSRYTSFLCLEDTAQICDECEDETQLVNTSTPGGRDSLFSAWPNPFSDHVTFSISPSADKKISSSSALEIYAANGQLARSFQLQSNGNEPIVISWDGRDDSGRPVPAGGYIAIARINAQTRVLKLIKQE